MCQETLLLDRDTLLADHQISERRFQNIMKNRKRKPADKS
jgi:hypothetical protein